MADEKDKPIPLELQGGSNLTKIKKDVLTIHEKIDKIEEKIGELQAQKQAHREAIKAMGIPKSAFDAARRRRKMDPDKRREYDHGYQIVAEALATQLDLFTPADERSDQNPASAPKETSSTLVGLDKAVEEAEAKAAESATPPSPPAAAAKPKSQSAKAKEILEKAESTSAARQGETKLN